jgi:CRISPR-associated endoribonuclease Cas6
LFQSWLKRWNYFANIYLGGDELIGYLTNNICLNHHRLRSRSFRVYQSNIVGFTGTIRLKIPQKVDPLLAQVAHLLVNYAQYSGTGIKTRLGMGYTNIIDDE